MTLKLSKLKSFSKKKRKRIGRGNSSKGGTYAGRGLKGQRARSGGRRKAGFRGKKSPAFINQIPKTRGFRSIRPKMSIVNIGQLDKKFTEGEVITPKKLLKAGIILNIHSGVKVLGKGDLKKKFTVSAHRFSKSAEDAIKKAGGVVKNIKTHVSGSNKKETDSNLK